MCFEYEGQRYVCELKTKAQFEKWSGFLHTLYSKKEEAMNSKPLTKSKSSKNKTNKPKGGDVVIQDTNVPLHEEMEGEHGAVKCNTS